jgi:acyl-CoA thioester hydrolase
VSAKFILLFILTGWKLVGSKCSMLSAYQSPHRPRFYPALAQTTVAYKAPLFLSDRVWVEMWLSALGYSSTIMHFQFFNATSKTENIRDQVMVAEGYQRNMFVDKDSWKTRRFTREEKMLFCPM